MDVTTIYLARHAQSASNEAGVISGHRDVPLTAQGRAQAAALQRRLQHVALDAVLASDLERACATAEAVAAPRGLVVQADPRWREMHYGAWEGQPGDVITQHFAADLRAVAEPEPGFRPPDGESLEELRTRVTAIYGETVAAHAGGSVLIVAHGGALNALVASVLGLPYAHSWRLQMHSAALSCIRHFDDTPVLTLFNDTSHLQEGV